MALFDSPERMKRTLTPALSHPMGEGVRLCRVKWFSRARFQAIVKDRVRGFHRVMANLIESVWGGSAGARQRLKGGKSAIRSWVGSHGIGAFVMVVCVFMLVIEMATSSSQGAADAPLEVIPPAPTKHFNDYAGVTKAATGERLDQTLADFEKRTTCQFVVALYPKMQTTSSMEDYTVRVFNHWGVGQKDKNNGVVLFVFPQDHKMRIATGRGLERTLPDEVCKRILDEKITPRFKQGDFDGGLTAGVDAIISAVKSAR